MNLTNFIVEADSFKLSNRTIDPETGRVSYTVEYDPVVKTKRSLEETESNIRALVKRDPDDSLLRELYIQIKALHRQFDKKYTKP